MKPMLPTLAFEPPMGKEWSYEVKYDGFRAFLEWDQEIKLTSRNGKSLAGIFPEITEFLQASKEVLKPFLPLLLDAELVDLANSYKADFGSIQVRGRMRSPERIREKASKRPCRLIVFDVLELRGENYRNHPQNARRKVLEDFFAKTGFASFPDPDSPSLLQLVPSETDFRSVWEQVILHDGEGLVAKHQESLWEEGKRTDKWIKFKNFKFVNCFVTAYEKSNGYFYVSVYKGEAIFSLGAVLFGFKPDEKAALFQTIKANQSHEDDQFIYVEPAICLEVKYLEIYDQQMREPHFHQFRFDLKPGDCTFDLFARQQRNLPQDVEITHPDKPIWEDPLIQKSDFIQYLREISPFMLPFLQNRLLTVIRFPHGMLGEAFYQKNCPDYAPEFIETSLSEGINYIVCNDLKTLMWLGNQIAIEYHIPFQTIGRSGPDEIVFDLDPPSRDYFHLAIRAALLIKEVLDQLNLKGFIKTSGNKGLQIYIPLPSDMYTYEDTRLFTSFIANYLVSREPDSFTIERLKKHRGNRLYVDYVQHAEGKTIICPFSPRGKQQANVAAPLFWDEVNEDLRIGDFTVLNMIERINKLGSPFADYFKVKETQKLAPVLDFLRKEGKKPI
ncbi:DNA ligase D [Bacillus sp. FJAT-27251]|uniref:DNA ligase D n=1 Tax=Bacillus sp. FJAT-27251 TaxID=1684142 RepID=UPI0006A784D8|nr:DNA ligase D [Bacillus sp. FJAT-27251]